jgi:hypothetical protein
MRRVAILVLTLIALAPSPVEADPCESCSPVYGYYRSCQAKCISAPLGGICQNDPQLPKEAYCLQMINDDPAVYACHEGSFDCCCSRVPPPL